MMGEQVHPRADDVGAALARLLSHDLRSPLGPIVLAVSSIAEDPTASPDVREMASFAYAQCDRMARLISSAVFAVRGAATPQCVAVDAGAIAVDAMERFLAAGGAGVVTVEEHVEVLVDRREMTGALLGLLEAAGGDGMDAGATVLGEDAYAVIRVIGPGALAASVILREGTPSSASAALILGARAIAVAHGGTVRARAGGIELLVPKAVGS